MKYSFIIGFLLLAIGFVAAFVAKKELSFLISNAEFALGLLYGMGSGLIVGGFLGWLYKRNNKETETIQKPTESNPSSEA